MLSRDETTEDDFPPEESLYYDPVYNPFGAPPPGAPRMSKGTSSHATHN